MICCGMMSQLGWNHDTDRKLFLTYQWDNGIGTVRSPVNVNSVTSVFSHA